MTDYIEEIEEQDDESGLLYEHLRIVVDKGQVLECLWLIMLEVILEQ